ncbi:unnamed protein product [Rotaria sp. Silwood1]|nr:unnamed protein product [Rotaria sp. Silwood1]CAF0894529.1 unnamed protein product [Rotaria sp. Silwood1]CAF0908416.1 unnamed protein product [Rotaria sp. Silwood1]CAF3352180.1 unnamed protein product [Rotaria sp. Silwood1]CAF3376424.1 unnamed protein product [Rotaria sp. Silwood1]
MAHHSYSFISLRNFLVWLCISMIIIEFTQAINDDLLSSSIDDNNDHPLYRRNSKKVAQMLQQMLQRGEMQVQPSRIHEFLHRLHRREAND